MLQIKKRKPRWKQTEKLFLKQNAGNMSDASLARHLNKTVKAIREMRYQLNIKKKCGRGIIELVDDSPFKTKL